MYQDLSSVEDERDLKVNISNSLKPSKQCAIVIGLIRCSFEMAGYSSVTPKM